jgi:hypothetical protein
MGPDPEKLHRDSNFDNPQYLQNETEMEIDENNLNDGYLILRMNDFDDSIPANDDSSDDNESDEDDEEEGNEFSFPQNPTADEVHIEENVPAVPALNSTISSQLVTELWNSKTPTSSSIEMTSEKSQEITQIMSKINLQNVPNWINDLNAEKIIDRIKSSHSSTANAESDTNNK